MRIKFDLVNLKVDIRKENLPWFLEQAKVVNAKKLTEKEKKELIRLCFYEDSDAVGELYNIENSKIVIK